MRDLKATHRIRSLLRSAGGVGNVHLASANIQLQSAAVGVLGVRFANRSWLGNVLPKQIRKDAKAAPVIVTGEISQYKQTGYFAKIFILQLFTAS